jgi:hypothetical protein
MTTQQKTYPEDQSIFREIFESEDKLLGYVKWHAKRLYPERKWEDYAKFYSRQAPLIFKHCESPIERSLWGSALCCAVISGRFLEFWAPPKPAVNFIAGKSNASEYINFVATAKLIYSKHPDRDKLTFQEFAAWKEPTATPEDIKRWDSEALLFFDLGLMFVPTVTLQPCLSVGGKKIRPDAVAFVPAYPDNCVVIECDGFEFHGSKESFRSDRERDRLISSELNMEIRRYAGHDIYHTPIQSGEDIYEYFEHRFGTVKNLRRKWMAGKNAWISAERRKLGNA